MDNHIKTGVLISYIDNVLSEKKSLRTKQHLESCTQCMREYTLLQLARKKASTGIEGPPDKVLDSILTYYNEKNSGKNNPLKLTWKHAFAGCVFAIIIACVVFFIKPLFLKDTLVLQSDHTKGSLWINQKHVGHGIVNIKQKDTLITGKKSSHVISHGSLMKIKMHANAKIHIDTLQKKNQSRPYVMKFSISFGKFDIFFDHNQKVFYSFTTPHGRIYSGGTTFSLNISLQKTQVLVSKGKINFIGKNRSHPVIISTGTKYIIDNSGKITRSLSQNKNKIQSQKKLPVDKNNNTNKDQRLKEKYKRQWP